MKKNSLKMLYCAISTILSITLLALYDYFYDKGAMHWYKYAFIAVFGFVLLFCLLPMFMKNETKCK